MLYQLSYTPSPLREVTTPRTPRKAQRTTGSPIHVPWGPVNTFCVAAR
jgi:hypothetical protein